MRISFYRGLVFNFLITVISVIFYIYADVFLIVIGFDIELSRIAHMMILSMIPSQFQQNFNEMIRNYLIAQNVTQPFTILNLIVFVFFPFGAWWFIYLSGNGIIGFGIQKFFVELIYFIGLIIILRKDADPQSIGWENLSEVVMDKGFLNYIKDFFSIVLGWYSGYIGIEIMTYFIALQKDNNLMAAWVSIQTINTLVISSAVGLVLVSRTHIAIKLGEALNSQAKNQAYMGMILVAIFGIGIGVLLLIFRRFVMLAFTEVEEVKIHQLPMLFWQGFLCMVQVNVIIQNTIMRLIDKAFLLSLISFICMVIVADGLSYLFLFVWNYGGIGVVIAYLSATFLFWLSCFLIVLSYNWNKNSS